MPEGPEYVKSARSLASWVGKPLVSIRQYPGPSGMPVETFVKSGSGILPRLIGSKVLSVTPKGKNLWVQFDNGLALHIQYISTGWLRKEGPLSPVELDFLHSVSPRTFRLQFAVGDEKWVLCDARAWSKLRICQCQMDDDEYLNSQGPDWGSEAEIARAVLMAYRSRAPVKYVLTHQDVTKGLGQYLMCEVLHRAKVHPRSRWRFIKDPIKALILDEVVKFYKECLEKDGHSHWNVFDKEDKPCPVCGTSIAYEKATTEKRGIYFCPSCQPEVGSLAPLT